MKTNRIFLLILISVFLLLFLISLTFILKDKVVFDKTNLLLQKVTPTSVQNTSTIIHSPLPKTVKQIPTLSSEEGYGVDSSSPIVRASEQEIIKLNQHLPFQKDLTTKNGVPVSILINSSQLQDNTWTVSVQIFGIDYHVTPDMTTYLPMKTAFRESADYVLQWIQQNGSHPEKLIIQWGDKDFIENKAQEWLKAP